MRYEPLPGPLEGWTYDEHGTIFTASGYRCDARHIEAALWLMNCFSIEARRFLIHSDEAANALRPVYELSDLTPSLKPTRLQGTPTPAQRRPHTETNRALNGSNRRSARSSTRG